MAGIDPKATPKVLETEFDATLMDGETGSPGDQTLFLREDAVERSWEIVAPVLDAAGTVHSYAAGTWGPGAADELIAPRAWRPT